MLYAYPIWDSLQTLKNCYLPQSDECGESDGCREIVNLRMIHWLSFWIMSFGLTYLPIPDIGHWICITLLYSPLSTEKLIGMSIKYMPLLESKMRQCVCGLKSLIGFKTMSKEE